jgi:hypothetical protein
MPPRKSDADGGTGSAAENIPPPEEKTPLVSRADVHGLAPEPVPLGADQVEVELPDGSRGVVDKVMAEAMEAAKAKGPQASVKQFPPEEVK